MSNIKNYTEQGGEKTVIGGELEIAPGGQVTGLSFPQAAFQTNSTAATVEDLVTDFNALLAKLVASGIMAAE